MKTIICQAVLFFSLFFMSITVFAVGIRGIYVSQSTLEDTDYLEYLIKESKASGINTFVVDLELPSKQYAKNIQLVKANGLHYVARIIIFPNGASKEQVRNTNTWQPKLKLMKQALAWGADEIQLDYIRYNTRQGGSAKNPDEIYRVVKWYKDQLGEDVPLQADVFGIASFGVAKHIGQSIPLFAKSIDTVCPMVYPSHYDPADYHYHRPFETIYDSLTEIQRQFNFNMPIRVVAWIEVSNYHYRMTSAQKIKYINEQLSAVHEAGINGWYAWSPNNKYDNLFSLLQS